jgi:hypothetical protein
MSDRDENAGEVLRSLPARRPQRRSARRDAGAGPKAPAKAVKAAGAKAAKPAGAKRPAASKPRGVRPSMATDAASSTPGDPPAKAPEGVELVGTAIQAAGELAQFGLTLGTKALRGAVKRIPRP